MTFEKTGGPAFPATIGPGGSEVQVAAEQWAFPGMTVRDYFAAQALSMLSGSWDAMGRVAEKHGVYPAYIAAQTAYEIADEMMKARDA